MLGLDLCVAKAESFLPTSYAKPEDITGAAVVLIGRIDQLQPQGGKSNLLEFRVVPLIGAAGFSVKDAVSITQRQHLGIVSLDLETVYFFPLQRGTSGYQLRDELVPLPIPSKAVVDGIIPKLKDIAGVAELLRATLGGDSPKASGLALMHLGSLKADVPLDQLRPLYQSTHPEVALGAVYCGLQLGDPEALRAIGREKAVMAAIMARENIDPSMSANVENAISTFPPAKVDEETLLASMQAGNPAICERVLGLAAQASPKIAVPVAMSALLKDDPNIAYQGVRTLMNIYNIETGPLRVSAPKFKKDPKKYVELWRQFVQEQMTP